MTTTPHVCLIGQILVDVTLPAHGNPYKLRAGGIMHAARALWAIGCRYSLVYCAPDYLEAEIADHVSEYTASAAERFGVVTGCPNVILITEPTESGNQGYEFLLRDAQRCNVSVDLLKAALHATSPTDVLLFPGGFDLDLTLPVVGASSALVHIDANFEPTSSKSFAALGRQFDSIILSTSSTAFLERYYGDYKQLRSDLIGQYCGRALLKENRGGSRLFTDSEIIQTPAQPRKIQHSVGVGDCFDAVFVVLRHTVGDRAALAYASCIAAEYACTTFPEVFRDSAQEWLAVPPNEIIEIAGTCLPWETRSSIQIYIAAPDFEHVDRRPIDLVASALRYHNFVPRLPVREHGQMGLNADKERRQSLCDADLKLLDECRLMLAVLLYDDPGTLIEIGIAVERGIPVIVFDPFSRADNLMLTQLPQLVSANLDEVITAVFEQSSRLGQQ